MFPQRGNPILFRPGPSQLSIFPTISGTSDAFRLFDRLPTAGLLALFGRFLTAGIGGILYLLVPACPGGGRKCSARGRTGFPAKVSGRETWSSSSKWKNAAEILLPADAGNQFFEVLGISGFRLCGKETKKDVTF